ncbi:kinase, partial [Parabacteroides merdae]|nr:kinase [Parabacteroides merdae]
HVKYDPNDLRSIRLYWEDNAGGRRFERVAEPYMVIHRALQDQTEGEAAFIRREQEANIQDRIDRQVIAKEIEYAYNVAPEQHGLST